MDGQGGDRGGDKPQPINVTTNQNQHQCEFSNCNSNTSIDKYKAKHVWRVMGGIQRVPEWHRSEFERNSSHEGTCHEGTTITLGDTRRHSLRCHTQHLQIWRHVMSHCSRNCSNPYAILIDVTRTKRGSWVMPGATTRSRLLLVRLLTDHTRNCLLPKSNYLSNDDVKRITKVTGTNFRAEAQTRIIATSTAWLMTATIAEIQLLVDVTRTTYYIWQCQTASITKHSMRTSHGLHPSSQCQPQLPKSNH